MSAESPPPDSRLADKLTIRKLKPTARLRQVNGDHRGAPSHDGFDMGLESADAEICRLAKLAPLEYERQRKDAAEQLDVRAAILDRLVLSERAKYQDNGKQGRVLSLPDPKPWPESVNGADLLDELSGSIRRHVVMPDHAADTAGLWVIHTYLVDCFATSPRLAITSPEKGCGKTTALDVLARLVSRPLATTNASASAIFRIIEMQRPTY